MFWLLNSFTRFFSIAFGTTDGLDPIWSYLKTPKAISQTWMSVCLSVFFFIFTVSLLVLWAMLPEINLIWFDLIWFDTKLYLVYIYFTARNAVANGGKLQCNSDSRSVRPSVVVCVKTAKYMNTFIRQASDSNKTYRQTDPIGTLNFLTTWPPNISLFSFSYNTPHQSSDVITHSRRSFK